MKFQVTYKDSDAFAKGIDMCKEADEKFADLEFWPAQAAAQAEIDKAVDIGEELTIEIDTETKEVKVLYYDKERHSLR